jgi:hypothetical protein
MEVILSWLMNPVELGQRAIVEGKRAFVEQAGGAHLKAFTPLPALQSKELSGCAAVLRHPPKW